MCFGLDAEDSVTKGKRSPTVLSRAVRPKTPKDTSSFILPCLDARNQGLWSCLLVQGRLEARRIAS